MDNLIVLSSKPPAAIDCSVCVCRESLRKSASSRSLRDRATSRVRYVIARTNDESNKSNTHVDRQRKYEAFTRDRTYDRNKICLLIVSYETGIRFKMYRGQ